MSFPKSSLCVHSTVIACLVAMLALLGAGGACLGGEEPASGLSPGLETRLRLDNGAGGVTPEVKETALKAFDLSPAVFIENKGQWDYEVRYGFDGKSVRVSFTDSGPVFQMLKSEAVEARPQPGVPRDRAAEVKFAQAVFSARFVGAKAVRPVALEPSSSRMNFYRGNDPSKWPTDVPTYSKIAYRGLYDGIDLYTWGKRSGLKYEFHVAPGASWEEVVIRYDGIDGLSIDDSGALHVRTPLGEIVDKAPLVYQETAEGRKEISARFRLIEGNSYGFDVTGEYDRSLTLVLDPDLELGRYLGGSNYDCGYGIAIDASGDAWVTGRTLSSDFPTPGGFDTGHNGGYDVFVAKITPSGMLEWGSYLGGGGDECGYGIAIDASGDARVTGETASSDFPVPGGFDKSYGGDNDAFVAKITRSGRLAWASYLGGSRIDCGYGIAIDASGDAWVTGLTVSSDFPVPGGFDTSYGGWQADGFVAKITRSGKLAWGSYLGGSRADYGAAIAIVASGNVWVTGLTQSPDFPTYYGFDPSLGGDQDAFVAKITPLGTVAMASFLGGSDWDEGKSIAIDASGNAYVTGWTQSSDYPVLGGFDMTYNGGSDAFVAKISGSGSPAWASYLGGSDTEEGIAVAIGASQNAWVTGRTLSSDFPTPLGGVYTSYNGLTDAFVATILTPDADWRNIADWLKIDKFQVSLGWLWGEDSFVLRGSFNTWFTGRVPQNVVLVVDGWWVNMGASSWKRVGKSNTYTFKEGAASGTITYWVGGTTKCRFTFSASRLAQGYMPHMPNLPVRLMLGGGFDKELTAGMTLKNGVARLSSVGPPPLFLVDKLTMTRNLRRSQGDTFKLSGRLFLTSDFNPASDEVGMEIGPYHFTIHAGTMPAAKNGIINYYGRYGRYNKLGFRLNLKNHILVVTATGIDLSSLVPETHVSLDIVNRAGAEWDYGLFLAANKTGTLYKY